MENQILIAQDITKTYCEGKIKTNVLKGVSFSLKAKSINAIVGKSGSGKSTLLHILGTLDSKDSGKIIIDNNDLDLLNEKQKSKFRNQNLGFIYQFHHLLMDLTALENVMLPMLIANVNKAQAKEYAKELLSQVNLSHRLNHKPNELSGGERQRVAIARALSNRPKLILADEPTGNLDAQNAQSVLQLLLNISKEYTSTILLVTHDQTIASSCDHVFYMENGLIKDTNALV